MEGIKGYKVFNHDWTCKDFKYEVGNTYEEDVNPSVCKEGFHFCKLPKDCFNYYTFDCDNKVAEVLALGKVSEEGDKCATNKIKIIREISWQEVLTLVNTGKSCTGYSNSGDRNSGDHNSGDDNSGHWNSGDWNSGRCNSGDWNSGRCNSGHCNDGDSNSGSRNSGDYNSGNYNGGDHNNGNYNSGRYNSGHYNSGNYNTGGRNSGDWNSGRCNSGDYNSGNYNNGRYNSGHYNSGNYNSGDWNAGDWNSGIYNSGDWNVGDWNKASQTMGCFNTQSQKLRFFDKETDMTLEEWRRSDAYRLLSRINFRPTDWIWSDKMTDEEKTENPEHETTAGYLKIRDNTDYYVEWWSSLSDHQRNIIKNIPNFDAEKFYHITGIKA